ncbi:6153_t:CDS:2, partial [Funneliformis caledonium]
ATIFRAVNRTTMPNMVESSSWIVVHQMYVRSGAFIFIGLIQDTCIKPWTHHPPSPSKVDTAFQSFLGWARLVIGYNIMLAKGIVFGQPSGNTLEG